jgi:Ca2+-binding EF-hand superfamily protein
MEELEYIVSKIDKNKSGKIDLSEFTAAIYDKRKLFVKDYLDEAFDYFDNDGTGCI